MRTHRFGINFLWASIAADVTYSIGNFAALITANLPQWKGVPLGIIASDVVMIPVLSAFQFPVIAVLALPLSLAAYSYQVRTGLRALPVFVATGAAVGFGCALAAFFTVLQWASDTPGWPDAMSFYTRTGPFAVIGGAIGGYVYWRGAMSELQKKSKAS